MTTEELHEIEMEIAIIKTKLITIEKDICEHRKDFKLFKEDDFRSFRDKMEIQRGSYFDLFLSKETFKEWVMNSFNPIKLIVWGMLCMVAGGALTAGLTFLFRKP